MGAAPLSAQHAVGRLPGLKEPALVSGPDATLWLIWLEQRPQERGRTTALIRRFGDSEAEPQELTPAPSNLRSRVHDYGGGVLATAVEQDRLILAWIERGCLWRQDWRLPQTCPQQPTPLAAPQRLSQEGDWELADGVLDLPRQRWIGIREIEGRDELVSLALNATDQTPLLLHQPTDFAGYGCLSP
ncbi:MAG: peptidase S9, partial [Cyanobacteria bacterium MAG COS3_bin_20]|nr:peptidase S9 [Cyanobacteria bacterium MAG COS3_bin_20]